ncbi:hypothetical protein [Acidilobus sp.]|uniref:hypothetical protein n=1 Tax=Acidilobus sp. TaxID=1872109 RepID=UPI003CFE8406
MQYSEIEPQVRSSIEAAKRLLRPKIVDGTLLISSHSAIPAAKSLYISMLSSGLDITLAGPTEASTLIMPYRDVNEVLVFSLGPKDSRAVRAAEEAALMGITTYFIAPQLDDVLEAMLSRHEEISRIMLPPQAPLLTMIVASSLWSSEMKGPRGDRLKAEAADVGSSFSWVSEKYGQQAEEASRFQRFAAVYGPIMEPSARYLCSVAAERCEAMLLLDEVTSFSRITVPVVEVISSVEEHDYKDVELSMKLANLKIVKLLFNVDPVTANLYASIVAALIGGKVI